jgi:hypothetical protein
MNSLASSSFVKSPFFRAGFITACSIVAFWLVYKVALSVFSDEGRLSEFGALTLGLIANLWTAAAFNWIATGNLFISSLSAPPAGEALPRRDRFIGSPTAIVLLSIVWLGVWFYVTSIHDALQGALFDSQVIGISLTGNEAMRLSTELSGLLSIGVTFPLLAASAFIVGWACSMPLRTPAMLIPATAFCSIAAVLNYGQSVMSTGLPPLYDAMRMMFGESESQITNADIAVMWIINIVIFVVVGCGGFAVYGRLWTLLGFWLRRGVNKSSASPSVAPAG